MINSAITAAIGITSPNIENIADEAIILLRRDIKDTTYANNSSDIATTLTIDLDGHNLEAKCITNTKTKNSTDSSGAVVETHSVINIKNGTLNTKNYGLFYVASGATSTTVTKSKSMTVNLENLNIGFEEGADTATLFGWNYSVAPTADGVTVSFDMNFKNCVIDTLTNRSSKSSFCVADFAKSASDSWIFNLKFEECEFRLQSEADLNPTSGIKYESTDTVYFAKTESGDYNKLTLPVSATAPTGEYAISNDKVGVFKEASRTDTHVTYKMTLKGTENIDFAPMASITLDSNLILNIYIPDHAGLKSATLNGTPVALANADGGYYVVSTSMSAAEAAKNLSLVVILEADGTELKGKFTFSTVKYVQKLLAMNVSDTEKALAKDMLAYVKSAYNYFDSSDKSEVSDAINAVIGNYNKTEIEKVTATESKDSEDILAGATLVLDSTPAIRFYISSYFDSADYVFSVNGKAIACEFKQEDANNEYNTLYYTDISLYAYQMVEEITITCGSSSANYHINAYYDSVDKSDAELVDIVTKFYNYCVSASAYRSYIQSK